MAGWAAGTENSQGLGEAGGGPGQSIRRHQSGSGNAKMIYTADLELETKAFDSASQALDQIVEGLGGYYESRASGRAAATAAWTAPSGFRQRPSPTFSVRQGQGGPW